MLHLSDFFAPLNFYNVFITLLFLLSSEIVGFAFCQIFFRKIPDFLRNSVWLIGLGVIVFFYFIIHFFLPLAYPTLVYVIIPLLIPSSYIYIKKHGMKTLLEFYKLVAIPLFITLLVIPQILVKSSQPPYVWDEMAYHFISPNSIYFDKTWDTGTSVTQNFPRVLDMSFMAVFSISKTYATARLLHFFVFITSLFAIYFYLRKNHGSVLAIVFFIFILFTKNNYLLWSTLGYIDIGVMCFLLLSIFSFLSFVTENKLEYLQYSLAFIGLALGSKYTTIAPFISIILMSIFIFRKRLISILGNSKFYLGAVSILILGGYWYIKNFIELGNPIYPFLFGCKLSNCEPFSLSYTLPFTLNNLEKIFSQILMDNFLYKWLFFTSLFLSLSLSDYKTRRFVLFVIVYFLIELFIIRTISGFELRYFYHWQVLAALIIVSPLSVFKLRKTNNENIN